MTPAQDIAMEMKTTPGVRKYAHRPRGAVLVMAIAASLAALLPNAAQAHHYVSGANGVGDATINLTPDGYPHPPGDPGEPYHIGGRIYTVDGEGFAPGDLVLIFQCPVTHNVVPLDCERLTAEPAPTGTFNVDVRMDDRFTSVNYPNGACYGPDFGNDPLAPRSVQCSVVALSYDPTTLRIHRMAEHYVCFTGMFMNTGGVDETKCWNEQPDELP